MNTNNVKKYAPKARKAFIEAMSKQAAKYGITKKKIEPAEQKGDLVLIGDRPFPALVIKPRERLVKRIEQQGFDQVMEHVAYSWFNRLCAIRYMERKGFLDHGRRVLSAADGSAGVPQILEECLDVELPGLDQAKVRELKLDGTKDEELYRELLLAQCHALHQAMPFLFEAVADESELLLPENLTKTDSLIRDLVASVPDEDWDHIEIIGWLYQFYISEKKDQVMGKVVKSEDIPAATQLFTPNWIVQYLVQNSVGRQWLRSYPDSPLKEKMPYYVEPAEQTPEVQAQLAAMTRKELKPEDLTVTDPACGSAHLIAEAYRVLKAIYEERGYRTRDIPQLILENNLFGLDIDDRAGQLAGFALMMLAREDDRRIFSRKIRLNVLSLQESTNVNLPSLWESLNLTGEWKSGTSQKMFEEEQQDINAYAADNRYKLLQEILENFKQAKTFGSLIDIPHDNYKELNDFLLTLCELESAGDTIQKAAATQLIPYVHQAVILAKKYDVVVANPPYMGSKSMNGELKKYVNENYPKSKGDLYSVFMERAFLMLHGNGFNAQINMHSWMFLSTYEQLREWIISSKCIVTMSHLGPRAFSQISGEVVQTTAWVIGNKCVDNYKPSIFRLVDGNELEKKKALLERKNKYEDTEQSDFFSIPGMPIAYWASPSSIAAFKKGKPLKTYATPCQGVKTGDNDKFLRYWHEVDASKVYSVGCDKKSVSKWFLCTKGGGYRKWFGNIEYVLNWENDGHDLKNFKDNDGKLRSRPQNIGRFFNEGASWSTISSGPFSMRLFTEDFVFESKGSVCFPEKNITTESILAIANTNISSYFLQLLSPTLDYSEGAVGKLPIISPERIDTSYASKLVEIHKDDWREDEDTFLFAKTRILLVQGNKVRDNLKNYIARSETRIKLAKDLEEKNQRMVSEIYGIYLDESPIANPITLSCNKQYRYGGGQEGLDMQFQNDLIAELVSYSIGCMFGRYSLDSDGLIYANTGNQGFTRLQEEGAYQTFPADDDGIIPLTDQEWFPDDATNRFREFVKVVWGEDHLHENLDFVAESLCLHAIKPKKSESSMDTIRRYLSTQFYKDHLKTYKKRPIYWLFSSGKQKAFECLVYLHRYNEGTLARMRTEYVIPLTAKMAAYAQKLENDKEASGSAAEVKRLEKEIAQLHKQQAELSEFDEKLRHYADQRISLNLDDGVKVNYGKFGDLLADVKAITGEAPEALS